MVETDWIIGLAIMFGLAMLFTQATYKDGQTFLIFLTIFCGFVVWSGLLDTWVLVLMIIVLTLVIINITKQGKI